MRRTAWILVVLLLGCDTTVPPRPPARGPVAVGQATPSAAASVSSSPAAASATPSAAPYVSPAPPEPPIALKGGGKAAVRGRYGLVTSVEPNATRAGIDVLRRGGNAVDAAITVAYVLAVTHPSAGNIGGGGFMIVRTKDGRSTAIDFRETAPSGVTTEKVLAMLDRDGAIGYRSAGVPGTVAGLSLARERFGTRPLAELMQPAIDLARKGHRLGPRQALTLSWAWPKLRQDAAAHAVYGRGKKPLEQGDTWRQTDLARTLETIAKDGDRAFYEGAIAKKIDEAMRAHGGYVTLDDLRGYGAKERSVLSFPYRGFVVDTMPPPSMGGVALADIMLTLEQQRAWEAPVDSGLSLHLFVEAARRAYAERRAVGADPDFVPREAHDRELARLLDGAYLAARKPPIDRDHATPSSAIAPAADPGTESPQTTHFSVVDAEGNAVSCTTTQSAGFGSKIVIPGTGLLLGNALGGFSANGPNVVASGKRMASSMAPAVVSQGGRLVAVIGSPGGDTIPNTVAQVLRNLVDYGMTIDEAVAHGRVHHQFLPDKVRVEKGNPPPRAALDDLVRRGHVIDLDATPLGDANDLVVDAAGVAWGYSDTREGGIALGLEQPPGDSGKGAEPVKKPRAGRSKPTPRR